MEWLRATIFTTTEGIEPVTGRLYRLGLNGAEIEDETEFRDFLENNHKYWDYVDEELYKKMAGETRVKVYMTDNAAGRAILSSVRESIAELKLMDKENSFGRLEIRLDNLEEEDWAENWKQYFKPIPVGNNLLIQPEWEPLPAGADKKTVFRIEPGMVFGTGSHESTRLCLAAAEKNVRPGDAVLDLGCGSGILSLTALLLGAGSAVCVDIDENAGEIVDGNARLNGISPARYTFYAGDILTDEALKKQITCRRYDVVFANIVADVIIAAAPTAVGVLNKGGTFICSGIIVERVGEVLDALDVAGFKEPKMHEEKGWAGIICTV